MSRPATSASIVRATAGDAEPIAALHATLFETPWSPETFALMLARDTVTGLIARQPQPEAALAGFAFVQVILDEAELMSIGVAAAAQRRGVGRALVQAALMQAVASGARALHLEVATTNVAACGLYQRLGFQQVGVRRGYYAMRNGRVDALLLRVEIS